MTKYSQQPGPIGVFDSGYGGLTILHGIRQLLPEYDYVYLGDNARAPYGSQNDLPALDPNRRVLGVIRPTAEIIGRLTRSRHVGLLATEGTVRSNSYNLEIRKLWPDIKVTGVPCPLWVPIIENNEADSPGADYFVKKRIDHIMRIDPQIDSLILGCTHYPILMPKILKHVPRGVRIIPQGEYVAESLRDYLRRHPDMDARCTKQSTVKYLTTENPEKFKETARIFLHEAVDVGHIDLE